MNQNIAIILSACITALVTIVGFVVTYFLNKRNFKEEVKKQKVNVNLEKMEDLPYKIQTILETMLEKKNDKELLGIFKELMISIFAYGSKDAIALVSKMQEINYAFQQKDDGNGSEKSEIIAYYILLLCQIKYDLTGIEINPQYWYRMRLTDYSKMKPVLDNATNRIVKELDLSSFLQIK